MSVALTAVRRWRRPETDVRRPGILRLLAGDLLERPQRRQAAALEEELSSQERAVELAQREDALAHARPRKAARRSPSSSSARLAPAGSCPNGSSVSLRR
jgi:hypothetical protein